MAYLHRLYGIENFDVILIDNQDQEELWYDELYDSLSEISVRDRYNNFGEITFLPLQKTASKKLTIEKISKIEKRKRNKDTFVKIKANSLFKIGNYEKAQELYTEYLKKYPNSLDALLKLGEIKKHKDNYEGALFCFNKALTLDHNNLLISNKIATLHYEKGDYHKTIEAFENLFNLINPEMYFFIKENIKNRINFNIALAYKELKDFNSFSKYLAKINKSELKYYLNEYNFTSIEDLYNSKRKIVLMDINTPL